MVKRHIFVSFKFYNFLLKPAVGLITAGLNDTEKINYSLTETKLL